jgi:glycosyltransferase involved in cell wall biosynthesis
LTVSLLLAAYTYPPVIGGSELEAQRVCASLIARGHRVEVLTGGGEPMPAVSAWLDPCGVPVRIFGNGRREPWKARIYALSVAWHLWRRRREYELVYFLMPGLQVVLGAPVARLLGKRVFMKFSGSNTVRPLAGSWMGRLHLRVLRRTAERIMVLNPGMVEEARDCGLDEERLCWMPNPVDTAVFAPPAEAERAELRERLGIPARAPVILFVGRLAPEKELGSLLDAFARLGERHPDACLVLVGDGPERAALERRAGLRVRFTGMTAPGQVAGWMQIADVFALVSSLEGFPCALAEAMSCGLAPVASDIPANRQLIRDGETGLLAPLRDAEAIAAALDRLLGDDGLRARLGRAARQEIAGRYSNDKVVERYEALFGVSPETSGTARPPSGDTLRG